MKNQMGSLEKKFDTLLEAVLSLGAEVHEIKEDLRTRYATKDDLFELKEELTFEIRAISKAVDKDAKTIIDHERRISRIENRFA